MARPTPEKSMSYDDLTDSAPSSDSDPYQTSTNEINYNIDITNFPKPLPILGQLFGFNAERVAHFTTKKLAKASQGINRPLSQDEAQAMAYYAAKQIKIMSYGAPVGVAGGLWRCYGTTPTFRFPFYQPDLSRFRFESFPTTNIAVVKGVPAMIIWHGFRAFAYGYMGKIVGEVLIGSYSASVAVVGEMSDPRLKAYIEDVRKEVGRKRQQSSDGIGQGQGQSGPPQIPVGQTGGVAQDDASPTGGMFGQADIDEGVSQPVPQRRPWGMRTPSPQAPQVPVEATPAQAKPFDMFDDASPTGAQQGMMPDTRPRQSQQSGSAWDRIRRGEAPPNQTPRAQMPSPEQRTDNDYMISKADEQSRYAKEEAQKEFDARIERERTGGDFNSGAGKKW